MLIASCDIPLVVALMRYGVCVPRSWGARSNLWVSVADVHVEAWC